MDVFSDRSTCARVRSHYRLPSPFPRLCILEPAASGQRPAASDDADHFPNIIRHHGGRHRPPHDPHGASRSDARAGVSLRPAHWVQWVQCRAHELHYRCICGSSRTFLLAKNRAGTARVSEVIKTSEACGQSGLYPPAMGCHPRTARIVQISPPGCPAFYPTFPLCAYILSSSFAPRLSSSASPTNQVVSSAHSSHLTMHRTELSPARIPSAPPPTPVTLKWHEAPARPEADALRTRLENLAPTHRYVWQQRLVLH